jgi:hypothetical protein
VDRDIAPEAPVQGEVAQAPSHTGTKELEAMARLYDGSLSQFMGDHAMGEQNALLSVRAQVRSRRRSMRTEWSRSASSRTRRKLRDSKRNSLSRSPGRTNESDDGAFDAICAFSERPA